MMPHEDVRIEFPSRGATYNRPRYGVYKCGVYPRGSVLAGQTMRTFVASFGTLEEAKAAYPDAKVMVSGASGYHPPDLSHLPDDTDY